MSQPDVRVTVVGGVAQIEVFTPDVEVEVRDYDVDCVDDDHDLLWTDENGDRCVRYFETYEGERPTG